MTKIPNKTLEMLQLPLPDIRDDMQEYTCKQSYRREDGSRFRPPKYKPRYDSNFNRSHPYSSNNSHVAHAISFRSDCNDFSSHADTLPLFTKSYNSSANVSYFEQCFTTLSKLGEGSFGEVFKVRSNEDGKLYAVKMSKRMFRGEQYRAERLEEVRRYEQFSGHENCINFYGAWEQDDRLYMQMELCRESLDVYLWHHKQVPEDRVWSILLDLLLGLKSLHDRNLIHLDIKLDNVLIDDDDTCKLADFGLVIDVDKANRHQATEGDSRYIAPEIMQGHFSKAADIFSLGIAMLELACFIELPKYGQLWQQLRQGFFPESFLQKISFELQSVIKDMMNPEPQARPTVNQLLQHKKFVLMQAQRKNWRSLKRIRKTIRHSRRIIWSKLCNIKNVVVRFFAQILKSLNLHKYFNKTPSTNLINKPDIFPERDAPKVHVELVESTPIQLDNASGRDLELRDALVEESKLFALAQQNIPMFNSTPLHRDISQMSFHLPNQTMGNNSSLDVSNISNLHKELSDGNTSSLIRRPLDTSSLRRKLFVHTEETNN